MSIRVMSREECLRLLDGASVARLACAWENKPYIVPVSLALYEPFPGQACFYGFTTLGQKLEWMRANPLVCVEVDDVRDNDRWQSVVASGRFEELYASPGRDDALLRARERPRQTAETWGEDEERDLAYRLLRARPLWWEPGSSSWEVRPGRDPSEPYVPIYYKIWIDDLDGRESTPDPRVPHAAVPAHAGNPPGR